jgi:hypothetical protein
MSGGLDQWREGVPWDGDPHPSQLQLAQGEQNEGKFNMSSLSATIGKWVSPWFCYDNDAVFYYRIIEE